MAADTISYVTARGTLTWTRATEAAALDQPELLADGYLFGPSDLTAECREIITRSAEATDADPVEVRYGYWYEFSADAEPTLTDVLAAMLLSVPGDLDIEGWEVLADSLITLDDDVVDGGTIVIR